MDFSFLSKTRVVETQYFSHFNERLTVNINFFKKIPQQLLLIILAIVYIICGFVVGYHQGYKDGQKDYINYVNKLTDNRKQTTEK